MAAVPEVRRTLKVVDREGLHARPCTRIARCVGRFRCDVVAEWEGRVADARSVLQLLGLMASGGALVEFRAVGDDAAACLDAVAQEVAKP